MKKGMKRHSRPKKFYHDPKKVYLKKIRIYPSVLYGRLDRWLEAMSRDGWHVVHCGIFCFVFEKGDPEEKTYFTYGLSAKEGQYSLSLRYPFLDKTYGVKKKFSKINANETKTYHIVEIDLQGMDAQTRLGYQEMVSDRNRLYLRYFIRNWCGFLGAVIVYLMIDLLLGK